jgi:guanine nucleotide-binding protein G(i) subunit alpha
MLNLSANRIHCFENVNLVIFLVAVSEYDQMLFEDECQNRLSEATMLWESIASSRWFEKSAFVLLLNKVDLFTSALPSFFSSVHFSFSPFLSHFPSTPSAHPPTHR